RPPPAALFNRRLHDDGAWDNYQCKHYCEPLQPYQVWVEFGKMIYYTYLGKFAPPRRYYFVAPQGVGTTLSNLLKRPDELRDKLYSNWERYCRRVITKSTEVILDGDLRDHADGMDFSIFDAVPPLSLIEQHRETRWHVARFGGGLPPRPAIEPPPEVAAPHEATYVRQLLDAYGDRLGRTVADVDGLADETDLREHFDDSRTEFYSAESLRAFSRDTLPSGEYERLQDEVYTGVIDQVRADHPDGYSRVLAVVGRAKMLPLANHPLVGCLSTKDSGGVCHQLANDERVTWTK
ncbi:MAG: hypothetical protein HQ559_14640, partial [Lentisphaerae bacterium]|nr:hypothetical protein [Lentisphaerota bacterium]